MTSSLLSLVIWLCAGCAALAEDSGLTLFRTGDDARGWEAVGRIDIDGKGFCTGALIAPDLVLTAAHCLFERGSDVQVDPARIEFLAGFRNGRALAYREVRRAVMHPDYPAGNREASEAVRFDVALLELSQPIRSTQVVPFETSARIAVGGQVGVVSYARDRAEAPSLQEVCGVLGREAGIVVMTCEVNFGSSGAPVFRIEAGRAQIVSVVSAMSELDGRPVSIGTDLEAPLARVWSEYEAGGGRYGGDVPQVRRLTPGARNDETGAKFVRP